MRPGAFAFTALAALLCAPAARGGGAARAQFVPPTPEQAAGRQSDYRPGRAAFLLRGPVRSVREEAYNLHGGAAKVFTGNTTLQFDERGRLVLLLQGNNQMEDLYGYRLTYREDGRVASQERHFGRSPAGRDVYVYADERRAVEVLTYDAGGALVMRVARSFDERGGETRSETEFIPAKGVAAPGRQVREMTHAYDAGGRLVSTTVKDSAGRAEIVVTSRSGPGRRVVTTMKYLKDGKEVTSVTGVATHDERGEVLSTESYAADGRLISKVTYERKYDARGNWVEEVIRAREGAGASGRESSFLRRRTITYF